MFKNTIFEKERVKDILFYAFIIFIILASIYVFFNFYIEIFLTLIFITLILIYKKLD